MFLVLFKYINFSLERFVCHFAYLLISPDPRCVYCVALVMLFTNKVDLIYFKFKRFFFI